MRKDGIAQRDANNLRGAYYRLKQQAKSVVGSYKRNLKKTGGGPGISSPAEPTELDWAIVDICPVDFEEDIPLFDCDDNSTKNVIDEQGDPTIFDGLVDPNTGVIVRMKNQACPESPLNILPKPSPDSSTIKSKPKRSIPMTETQSKMVSLHERQINEKIEKNNELVNLEMDVIKTKLRNEEELHKLQVQELNLKIENEMKTRIIRELKIQKIKLDLEKLLQSTN